VPAVRLMGGGIRWRSPPTGVWQTCSAALLRAALWLRYSAGFPRSTPSWINMPVKS
jgi:hypothetical protein